MGKIISLVNDDKTITNQDIYRESLFITESLCSNKVLQFGSCEATQIQLRIKYETVLNDTFMLQLNDGDENKTIGIFHVTEDKPTADKLYRDIKACDNMQTIINKNCINWYRGLSYPMSLKNFRDSFFNYVGVQQQVTALPNDDMLVEMTVDSTYLSGKQIMNAVCEINGCFGHVDEYGVFNYVFLTDSGATEIDKYKAPCTYEDFTSQKITMVTIRANADDIGASAGVHGNDYIIEDNPLCYGKSSVELQQIASNMLNVVKDISYTPFSVNAPANDCSLGGRIIINTSDRVIESYLLQRTTTGIQSQFSKFFAKGTEKFSQRINGIASDIKQLKGKSNELSRSIEQTNLRITDTEQGLRNEIVQTADSLTIQIEDLQREIDGDISVYTTDAEPTLMNYPAWDFTYNIPCDNTVAVADDLTWIYIDSYYKKNARSIAFDSSTGVSYRFEKKDGVWGWSVMPDSEYSFVLEQIAELKVTSEQIAGSVQSLTVNLENNYMTTTAAQSLIQQSSTQILQSVSADYITKDLANSSYETKVHAESQIRQLADSISLKVTKGNVSSEISQESDVITIRSNRFVLDSSNCQIAANGSIKATNVELTGKVTATSGKIGGMNINTQGLTTVGLATNTVELNGNHFKASGILGSCEITSDGKVAIVTTNTPMTVKSSTSPTYYYTEIHPGKIVVRDSAGGYATTYDGSYIDFGSNDVSIRAHSKTFITANNTTVKLLQDVTVGESTGYVGFFGGNGAIKQSVNKLSSTASQANIISKVNELLEAMRKYNLISSL